MDQQQPKEGVVSD
jgi:hypothetical protein